jgi:hypothetical protein
MATLVFLIPLCLVWGPVAGQGGSTSERSVLAIRYEEGKTTDIRMDGTPLAPRIKGKAKVKADDGSAGIEIEFDNLPRQSILLPVTPRTCSGRSRLTAGRRTLESFRGVTIPR